MDSLPVAASSLGSSQVKQANLEGIVGGDYVLSRMVLIKGS